MRKKTRKRGYRVVSVSLYTDQANWLDIIAERLATAGYSKANRSLVVQEAILCLQEQLQEIVDPRHLGGFFRGNAARRRSTS